jgi:lipopolysaccharide transport system permease protein
VPLPPLPFALVRRHAELLVTLAESDLRVRFGRGRWQLVKWLVDPVALIGVYLVFVAVLLDRGGEAPALSVALAVVPFQLIMRAVANGLTALPLRASIVRNMAFPGMVAPAAGLLTELAGFVACLPIVGALMAVYGIGPDAAIVWLPVVLSVTVLLALAGSYAAALVALWATDLKSFLLAAVRAAFFLAPGIVAYEQLPQRAQDLVVLNPLSGIFEGWRAVLLHGEAPAAWHLLVPLAAAIMVLGVAYVLFQREQPHYAKVLP